MAFAATQSQSHHTIEHRLCLISAVDQDVAVGAAALHLLTGSRVHDAGRRGRSNKEGGRGEWGVQIDEFVVQVEIVIAVEEQERETGIVDEELLRSSVDTWPE